MIASSFALTVTRLGSVGAAIAAFVIQTSAFETKAQTRMPIDSPRAINLNHPSISPDGRLVAVHFDGNFGPKTRHSRVAIFDVTDGSYVLIPQAEGWNIKDPAFSPDGRSVAVVASCCGPLRLRQSKIRTFEVRLYDVRTRTSRTLTSGSEAYEQPAFAKSGRELVVSHKLAAVDREKDDDVWVPAFLSLADGRRRDIATKAQGFEWIHSLHQDRDGSIQFRGRWPQDPALRAAHKAPHYDRWSSRAYRLGLDGNLAPSAYQLMAPDHTFMGLATDASGKRTILTTWLEFKFYVFLVEGNQRRLLPLDPSQHVMDVSISADGKKAAFWVVGGTGMGWDLALLDIDSGLWTHPDWRKQLERDVVD